MSGGGSSGGQNTTNTVQQIPEFEQDFSQQNQNLAQSIASQPYPTYNAPLVQGMDPLQTQGQNQALSAANAYVPELNAAANTTQQALNPSQFNGSAAQSFNEVGNALNLNPTTPGAIQAYMSPYLQASLQPQIQDLQTQLALQQRGIDAQATQAGAFGDARQGAQSALQNYYGDQSLNSLVSNGYNTAYNNAVSALGQQQQAGLAGAQQYGNLAGLANQQQQTQLAGGAQQASLGQAAQNLGLTGAGATYTAGQQNQQQGQQELNTAYQQYLNQVNWPTQMLNIRESALSNSPYNIATSVQLPAGNSTAQGFGSLAGLAGILGGLGSGSSGGGSRPNVFGAA